MTRFALCAATLRKVLEDTKAYQQRTIKLSAIPFFLTFTNAFLGLLSILQTLEGNYQNAAYCLILAAILDTFDGRIARFLGSSSKLGTELDSLADAISFCVAPCILLYAWFPGTIGYTAIIALTLYLCAGIFRLAKFNISNTAVQADFTGLPTPAAAFFIVSLVLYQHWIVGHSVKFMLYKQVPFILMISVALLMISSIPFPSFKSTARRPLFLYLRLIALWSSFIFMYMQGYPSIFICTSLYIMISIARWLYIRHRTRNLL